MKIKRTVVYNLYYQQEGAFWLWHGFSAKRAAIRALRQLANKRTAWSIVKVTTTEETVEEFKPCTSTKR